MTLMALVVAVTAGAQGTSIHEYPWNPDSNNDTYIGFRRLDGLLSTLWRRNLVNPPEPCDYDGTPLEELLLAVMDGELFWIQCLLNMNSKMYRPIFSWLS